MKRIIGIGLIVLAAVLGITAIGVKAVNSEAYKKYVAQGGDKGFWEWMVGKVKDEARVNSYFDSY